jgi:hypothetical protein
MMIFASVSEPELLDVQQLVAQSAVERLDERVL